MTYHLITTASGHLWAVVGVDNEQAALAAYYDADDTERHLEVETSDDEDLLDFLQENGSVTDA